MLHAIGAVHRMQLGAGAREGFVAFGHGRRALVYRISPGGRMIRHAPRAEPDGAWPPASVAGVPPRAPDVADSGAGWFRGAFSDEVDKVLARPLLCKLELPAPRDKCWTTALGGGPASISERGTRWIAWGAGLV